VNPLLLFGTKSTQAAFAYSKEILIAHCRQEQDDPNLQKFKFRKQAERLGQPGLIGRGSQTRATHYVSKIRLHQATTRILGAASPAITSTSFCQLSLTIL
jgi:hypothetical protein